MISGERSLDGKVAIITGGGTGLGKAMALALAKEGVDIVVAARRVELIEQTAKEVSALGRRGLAIPTDVTDSQQVNRLVEQTLSKMGGIDILINNAGGGEERKLLWDITDEEWHRGINTNLTGTFFCCRAAGKHLVSQKSGKVINISSGVALRGRQYLYMYQIAKAGVIQLTRALALSWAEDNVQVNCIVPGFFDTSASRPGRRERETEAARRMDFFPVGRAGMPQEIGSLAIFLASDASSYTTGGIFASDGGALAGGYAPTGYAPIITIKED